MGIEEKRRRMQISGEIFRRLQGSKSVLKSVSHERKMDTTIINSIPSENRIFTNNINTYKGSNFYPDYIDSQKDKPFIVMGCGESINFLSGKDISDFMVIGINDIERIATPNYLVVVNHQRTFSRGRFEWVTRSKSPVIFSHIDPGVLENKRALVNIELGSRGKADLTNKRKIDYTMNSPYMAVILAHHMGASKIGIIGVDFTENHFFAETGKHVLSRNLNLVDAEYSELGKALTDRGIKIANLSSISSINSWPKMDIDQFRML